jgi:hypothetical protein
METDKKIKQQAEWTQLVTLTQEQIKDIVKRKLERNAVLQCKKKSYTERLMSC